MASGPRSAGDSFEDALQGQSLGRLSSFGALTRRVLANWKRERIAGIGRPEARGRRRRQEVIRERSEGSGQVMRG